MLELCPGSLLVVGALGQGWGWGHPKIAVGAAVGAPRWKKPPPFVPISQLCVHWGRSGQAVG